jgi:cytochrome c-type biogenesis protein CcmH
MMLIALAVTFCLLMTALLALVWRYESRRRGATVAAGPAWAMAAGLVVLGGGLYWLAGYEESTGEWLRDHRRLQPMVTEILEGRSPGEVADDDTRTGALTRVLQRELVRRPDSVSGWYALGLLYHQMKEPRMAVKAARKGLEVAGGTQRTAMELLLARSLVAANQGQLNAEAEQILLSIVETHPNHDGAWTLLAMAASRSGRHALAERAFENLLKRHDEGDIGPMLRKGLEQARAARAEAEQQSATDETAEEIVVQVSAGEGVRPGGTVFVFLRGAQSGGKPLAARRMPVDRFPVTVRVRAQDWLQQRPGDRSALRAGARYSPDAGAGVGSAGLRAAPEPLNDSGGDPDVRLELRR